MGVRSLSGLFLAAILLELPVYAAVTVFDPEAANVTAHLPSATAPCRVPRCWRSQ
jgi:hypothetical protein